MSNFYRNECGKPSACLIVRFCAVLLLAFLFVPASAAWGMTAGAAPAKITVSGSIRDEAGTPVQGATVTVKDKPELGGALSDEKGLFRINVPAGSILVFRFIGYTTVEKTVAEATSSLKVVMQQDTKTIEDIVVVGYGTQTKESVVGAISQVDNEKLVNSGSTNLSNALSGKILGVNTMQTQGTPGDNNSAITIRGLSSWNGSSPLVMVDGVERSLNDIDPNDVASISVLKDASATAVFGAKGANGVILVTTRTGSMGEPKMSMTLNYGIGIPYRIPEHISSYTTGQLANVAYMNNQMFGSLIPGSTLEEYRSPSSRINSLRYPDNDWYGLMMKKFASNIDANFNISGGIKWLKYFASVGYTYEGPAVKKFNDWDNARFTYNRINYRSNLDFTITKSTVLSVKVGGDLGVRQYPSHVSESSLWGMVTGTSPMMFPAYFPEWALDEIPDTDYPNVTGPRLSSSKQAYYGNPYAQLNFSDFSQQTRNTLYTDALLKQELDFITPGLSLNAKVSLSNYFSRTSLESKKSIPNFYLDWSRYDAGDGNPWIHSAASSSVYEDSPYKVTQGDLNNSFYTIFYWEGSLNYSRTFNKKHSVGALALFNQRERANQALFPYRNQALVGRVTYDYAKKYLFEFNLGYTGSEQFSPTNRYGIFPSVGVGYTVSQEKFWRQSMPWWNKLKLRYSDGLVGSDSADDRWLYYSSYSRKDGYIYEDAMANLAAKWETARKRDFGIEMAWLDNKLTMNVDFFDEQRKDMLISPNVTMLVATSYKNVNKGELKKHGIDFELGFRNQTKSGFEYEFAAMLSLNENRIVNYEDAPYSPLYQKYAGTAYGGQRKGTSRVDSGYYTSVDDIHNYPAFTTNWLEMYPGTFKFLDYNADGIITADDLHYIQGSKYAPTTFSLQGGFGYKGFEFSVLFYGNLGKWVEYNKTFAYEFIKGDLKVSKTHLDYWTPDHQNASYATMNWGEAMYNWGGGLSDSGFDTMIDGVTWRRANFISLKEARASYTFPSKKLKSKLGISNLSIYVTGTNLWTVTNLLQGNPEATDFTSGFYPMLSTVKIGLKFGF